MAFRDAARDIAVPVWRVAGQPVRPDGEGQAAPQAIKVGKELRFNPGEASSCFLRASRDWLRCIPIDQRSHHCPGLQILRA